MKYSVEGIGLAACVLAFTHCGGQNDRLVLITSGDPVRILSMSGAHDCPSGWNAGDFDDSKWTVAPLPVASTSTGACMRARFDVGENLARYRWLNIDLSALAQARLTSSKPLGATQGLGSINWTTQDGGDDATALDKHYTLDLALFPDLLQARQNVLALQLAASPHPVSVSAELDIDNGTADPFVHAVKGPYMVRPTAGTAHVAWETSSSAPSWIVVDAQPYDGGWAVHHDVPIAGLIAGTVHPVHVESAEASALPANCTDVPETLMEHVQSSGSDTGSQWQQYTQRRDLCQQLEAAISSTPSQLMLIGKSSSVRLVVVGDTRADAEMSGDVLQAASLEAPDLIVHTGDLVNEATYEPNWQSLFDHAQPLFAQAPVAPTIGERDMAFALDRFGQLFAVTSADTLGHVYSVDQGPVHVALLDSNADLAAQASWLDADLTAAEAAGATHELVVLHWGPYSAGPRGSNHSAVDAIVPVLLQHKVDAVFSGHDNIYEHGVANGLNYFVSGGGGDTSDAVAPLPTTVSATGTPHYLIITVDGAVMHVQAKSAKGAVIDDVTLVRQ